MKKGYPPFFTLKTLSRKLYMPIMTIPQMKTMSCCDFGSAILGTFKARAIVANDKTPSRTG